MTMARVVLLAPVAGALAYLIPLFGRMAALPGGLHFDMGLLVLAVWGYLAALILTVFVGLPLGFLFRLALRANGKESGVAYGLGGTVIGGVAGAPFGMAGEFIVPAAIVGLSLGLVYWTVVRRRALVSEQSNG